MESKIVECEVENLATTITAIMVEHNIISILPYKLTSSSSSFPSTIQNLYVHTYLVIYSAR